MGQLPDGSDVTVTLTPRFLASTGKATLEDPDDVDGRLLSYPRHATAINPASLTVSVESEVTIDPKQAGKYFVGFKQLAKVNQVYAPFDGTSATFGSIVEQSTTPLNGQWLLDCWCTPTTSPPWFGAPQAPFYAPKQEVFFLGLPMGRRLGRTRITMGDEPSAGSPLLRRENKKRMARNYLRGFVVKIDFITFVVVEQPDGTQVPVQGFTWSYDRNISIDWSTDLKPTISADIGSGAVQTNAPVLTLTNVGTQEATLLKDRGLTDAECLVVKFARALEMAKRTGSAPGYQIVEY